MLWNTLKDGLCYLRNESVSMKVFLLNMHEVRILLDLEKPTRHLIYYTYYFFYENYWPCLTWSSKCRGRVSHGNINFWFSGSASQRSTQTRMLYIEASSLSIVRSRETVPKEQNKTKRTQVDIVCYCNFIKVIKGPSTKNFRIS